jgi:hypothetical protein
MGLQKEKTGSFCLEVIFHLQKMQLPPLRDLAKQSLNQRKQIALST